MQNIYFLKAVTKTILTLMEGKTSKMGPGRQLNFLFADNESKEENECHPAFEWDSFYNWHNKQRDVAAERREEGEIQNSKIAPETTPVMS